LDGFNRHLLHFCDHFTKSIGASGATVDQLVVQKTVLRSVVGESENVADAPNRSGARGEVEFRDVFVLVEPGIQQEGLELHTSTPKKKSVLIVDTASRRTDVFCLR
jgi:hypothetical protein